MHKPRYKRYETYRIAGYVNVKRLISSSIGRARAIPRDIALKRKINKVKSKRAVFAVKFDPRLPSISNIGAQHWRAMVSQDQYLADCFAEPPLTAYRRPTNLKEFLIRAKVPAPPDKRIQRNLKGMTKCGFQCTAWPYTLEGKSLRISERSTWKLNRILTCNNLNIVYMIECNKENCRNRYIGETKRSMKHRLADHRGYIVNKHVDKATGAHYNLPGHSLANLKITILEQVRYNDDDYRKEREKYFINKFNTYNRGLNRQK